MRLQGWVIYNGNLGDQFLTHAEIFQQSAAKQDIDVKIVKNNSLFSSVFDGQSRLLGGEDLSTPDFVLFWDKDLYLARQLEMMGIRLFNSARAIEICDDKCLTYQVLSNHNIPIPKTIIAPKIYQWSGVRDYSFFEHVIEELGFPMVIKEAFGSFGSQVYLVHNKQEFIDKIAEINDKPFLFQQYIRSSHGVDLRLQVVGKEVVASMKRVSENDFRANNGVGATPYPHNPTVEQAELAIKCAELVGCDFAGVDLLFGEHGEPILCEVNSNAHIMNLHKCTGINAADYMMAYIKKELIGG